MTKQIVNVYTFDPVAKTVTLPEFDSVSLTNLALITNVTRGVVLFNAFDPSLGATVSGNVITLNTSTTGMSATDQIRVDYASRQGDPTAYERQIVGNARSKFRDGFASVGTQPDPGTWSITNPDGHIITQGGNSSGSSYLRISMNPLLEGTEVQINSKQTFRLPMRTGFGVTASQRVNGQEFFAGMVEADTSASPNMVVKANLPADKPISAATISVTTNVGTITVNNHGFTGGDRVHVYNCPSSLMNVAPVIVTVVDQNTITVPIVATNGSYNSTGGMVGLADPLGGANNGSGYLWESVTTTTASLVSRRNGARFRTLAAAGSSTVATQANTSPFTDAFNSAGNFEEYLSLDEVSFRSFSSDGLATMSGAQKFTQGIPDEGPQYRIQARVKTLPGQTRPIARITSISKSGTATATVTTDLPHGLTTDDWIAIYGVRDQVNFANMGAAVQVASVPTSTTFTVAWSLAVTATSAGGDVWRVQGGTFPTTSAFSQVVQTISRTAGVMTVTGNATWATPLPGETVYLHGLDGAGNPYEGMYRVLKVSTTSLLLDAAGPDFAAINCGGTVIRVTDVRLHFARVMDYTRHVTEITGGRGMADANNSVPAYLTGGSITASATQSTGVSTTQWNAAGWGGFLVADVAAAALTVTTTTTAVSPGVNVDIGTYAHSFNVVVTAATGTSPTLDVGVEESFDNGINWVRVYDFPRIKAVGSWTSPLIRSQHGTRFRYVQTVTGTTPSFTRAINRLQYSSNAPLLRRFVDRSVVLTTLNSVTPSYFVEGTERFMLAISLGAVTTTAPALQLEGSEDAGTTWFAIGAPLTGVASSVVRQTYSGEMPNLVRARVSTAGVGVTADYVLIKAIGA